MRNSAHRGFTIIELLVVVSIIALLIGILLPAITKARDQARLTGSQTNMRNLATAHQTYASEWGDRQFTLCNDNIGTYGASCANAYSGYAAAAGGDHPPVLLGWAPGDGGHNPSGGNRLWGYWMDHGGNHGLCDPLVFTGPAHLVGFGAFRIPNAAQFNQYVSGRFYDEVFYAPKDTILQASIAPCLDNPGEFCTIPDIPSPSSDCAWSSYCSSPAAMFSPDVMANPDRGGWMNPYDSPSGLRSPSFSQALYPSLKTHMLEHNWLQQRRAECNPNFIGGTYADGCEPFYFNHGWESVPVAMFYDGHVGNLGVREAQTASNRNAAQTGWHLWSQDTPFGLDGYFIDAGYDTLSNTGFHVLTTDGIRGRDTLGDG